MTIAISTAILIAVAIAGFVGGRLYEFERLQRVVHSQEFKDDLQRGIAIGLAEMKMKEQNQN